MSSTIRRNATLNRRHGWLPVAVSLVMMTGCGNRHTAAPPVTAHPTPTTTSIAQAKTTTATVTQASPMMTAAALGIKIYSNTAAGIQLSYPADWQPAKTQTAALAVAAPASSASLCLDIPKMPWHIRNMIPMSIVASDYVSDLKKNQIPDAAVQEEITITLPDASARRITCSGHANGKPSIDVAIIMIHNDQVYILSADSDDAGKTTARSAIDGAAASLKWIK